MLIDNHIHTGWFKGHYYSAEYVWDEVKTTDIDHIAVSSLSSITKGFHKTAIREMKELLRLGKGKVSPLLWVSPDMFKPRGQYVLRKLLHSKIEWKGIKIHFYQHPEWGHNYALACQAFALARKLHLPVLTHTGGTPSSDAGVFKRIAKDFPDVTIVLAHGRPIEEAIEVLKNCPNTLVDTAFMPQGDQKQLIDNGLADRILFGTDIPINKYYYPDVSTKDFVKQHLAELKDITTPEQFAEITGKTVF
ncbi:MAG: amidohydrolase family protein [Bacteroidales bacterium]|nr:amidohydrolase family protein [Bacteroidales bacterium]